MEVMPSGGVIFEGPDEVEVFRRIALLGALRLETYLNMRMSRGRTAYSIAKSEFGLRGSKKRVLAQYEALLVEWGMIPPDLMAEQQKANAERAEQREAEAAERVATA